jgi:cell division protein FtsI/penicillin-binding protein 2
MHKRIIFIILIFIIIFIRIFQINYVNKDYYKNLLFLKTNNYVYGTSSERGRILDINGKVLVDNVSSKSLYFNDVKGLSLKDKINIAYQLSDLIEIDIASVDHQKEFYLILNNNGNNLITNEEKELYKKRKISNEEINKLKLDRINLDELTLKDKKVAQIYYLMNKDYKYNKKEIKNNVSDEEYAKVMEANIKGITGELVWNRNYPYNEVLKSILGRIGPIPLENKDKYLNNGYSLTDTVGLSFIEKEYEEYLKGEKAIYKTNNDGTLTLIKDSKKGSDVYLNIDIDMELKLIEIAKEEMVIAKSKKNTDYFHDIYLSLGEPSTGNIKAILGLRYNDNGEFSDITSNILSSSFTVGSVVKGATIAVGYNNDLITPGKYITDGCIKIYGVPEKCSFKRLGKINDLTALAYSSNYYQFLIAVGLTNNKYSPNIKLNATDKEFNIYRNTLASYGLGSLTGIDLEGETIGQIGKTISDDLLLNLSIGQYDSYTDIQLLQYINSIAMSKRIKLNMMNKILNNGDVIKKNDSQILNNLEINNDNMSRVHMGLQKVLEIGTGKGAVDMNLNPVGKTGTSETVYNGDNKTIVISTSLAIYYPEDNPKYSLAIIAPNISYENDEKAYTYPITKHISKKITDFLFLNY